MKPYLIGIAGPSGAGKSVLCRSIQSSFQNISRLKFDDFFKDHPEVGHINGFKNWDHPTSIHWDLLLKAVEDLKNGHYAMVPNYDRKVDARIGSKCVFPAPIILIDGFMTLAEPRLRTHLDLSIFLDLSEASHITRRRIRQPWVEDGYLNHVMIPAAKQYIWPSKHHADHIIDAEPLPTIIATNCINIIKATFPDRMKEIHEAPNFRVEAI